MRPTLPQLDGSFVTFRFSAMPFPDRRRRQGERHLVFARCRLTLCASMYAVTGLVGGAAELDNLDAHQLRGTASRR